MKHFRRWRSLCSWPPGLARRPGTRKRRTRTVLRSKWRLYAKQVGPRADLFRGDSNQPGFTASPADREAVDRVRLMMHQLLAERFKLRMHHETRQLPIYVLVMAKGDGQLGPDLRRSTRDCVEDGRRRACLTRAALRAAQFRAPVSAG